MTKGRGSAFLSSRHEGMERAAEYLRFSSPWGAALLRWGRSDELLPLRYCCRVLADIASGLVALPVALKRVAAPAWAMDKILPGKMPRIRVAETVSSRAMVSELFSRGTNCTGASSAGLP